MRRLLRWIVVVSLVAGVLLPLLPQLIWPFTFNWFFPSLVPQEWSLRAWRYVASPSSRVAPALWTSTGLALTVVAISIVVGLPAARALALQRFRGRQVVEWLIMLPIIVPTLVVAMGIHISMIRYGLADTFLGVALVHLVPALPYFVLVMGSVFAIYDTDYEATARTLGAPPWRVFLHVTLPAILPGLVVASMFTFLVSWSQYITTVLIGGGQVLTLPMVLFPFISAANHPNAAAVSLIFIAPAIMVLLFTTRVLSGNRAAVGGLGRL